ncbi:armadillo repeat-containing protein 7 [Diorhabda carinulata]|uniref:armadillo repeat-containing protein 7 n=1 Tax=Diorhabda carinulata TaxID=1163345 RepID=UPI0025A2E70D|nr:armadillo repeat-containing protein 7 [Diorhabda carinulata]
MFTRRDQLIQRTGEFGVGRYDFLKQLINEFTKTTVYENKRQTLANLANFAYDPINYNFIKQLHVIDLFLAELSNGDEELIHFALGGLCNIACDPESRDYIVALNGIKLISDLLLHDNEEISLNALTTLFYLFESHNIVIPNDLKSTVMQYESSNNRRFKNLGSVFLQTYLDNGK